MGPGRAACSRLVFMSMPPRGVGEERGCYSSTMVVTLRSMADMPILPRMTIGTG
jgi:hypothetical protein